MSLEVQVFAEAALGSGEVDGYSKIQHSSWAQALPVLEYSGSSLTLWASCCPGLLQRHTKSSGNSQLLSHSVNLTSIY
jgi:hypothetical protein